MAVRNSVTRWLDYLFDNWPLTANDNLPDVIFLKNGPTRPLFVYFHSFQTQILQKKTVDVSRIRTRIVGVEGEHADLLTITTTWPLARYYFLFSKLGLYFANN